MRWRESPRQRSRRMIRWQAREIMSAHQPAPAMSWLVDNATTLYILFGLIAVALVMIWRSNRQNKYLGYAAGAVGMLVVVWLLTLVVPSDSKQLEINVNAMAQAVMDGKVDDLFKHISNDFKYHTLTRDDLYKATQTAIKTHKVDGIGVSRFKVEELSRDKKFARASFVIAGAADAANFIYRGETDFVLEGEAWKVKTMRFYNPVVNQDQEIRLPGI